jgi:flagellar L-ring protein precursor FlgH
MKRQSRRASCWVAGCLLGIMIPGICLGQNNSPFQIMSQEGAYQPLTMEQGNLIRSIPVQQRQIREHDIFTVRIEELSRFSSEGDSERRKTSNYFARLQNWVRLNGFTKAEPTQQSGQDPTIQGDLRQTRRAEGDIETTERLTINVAVEVVDIRPNGNLIIEGHKEISVNDELWIAKLTGTVRQEDIGIDRVILSENIANLRVERALKGFVNDSYRRGWFDKAFDRISPF